MTNISAKDCFSGILLAVLLSITCPASALSAEAASKVPAGLSRTEALRLGERMYREGIMPSGAPIKAIVKGDVPVDGSAFTCANCHQKSGFGSMEGTVRTPPINAARLASAISKFKGIPIRRTISPAEQSGIFRPAYTDETLGKVIRTGIDPGGRQMNDAMPVYFLNDRDTAILVYYLWNLSSGNEPGVTDTTIRFATVVTSEVSPTDREAMVAPLRDFIEKWYVFRRTERMIKGDIFIQDGDIRDPRELSLVAWELTGPPATWQRQLKEHYQKEPVFALLGGITTGEWEPVHRFCEDNKIPALFPITDFPVINGRGGYTFYLSKGLYQEGEAAARFMHRDDLLNGRQVVQVFRKDRAGLSLSSAFHETWTGLEHGVPADRALEPGQEITASFWKDIAQHYPHAAVLVWLNSADFPALDDLAATGSLPDVIIASSGLLGRRMYAIPEQQRASVYITYPYSLPQEAREYRENVEAAIRSDGIKVPNLDVYYRLYPLFSVMNGPLARMRTYVYRDFFMELLESSLDLSTSPPVTYPRLSFGQGQRYASKGCYIVQLSAGPQPELVKRSEWITY